jgi:hypothetical protein
VDSDSDLFDDLSSCVNKHRFAACDDDSMDWVNFVRKSFREIKKLTTWMKGMMRIGYPPDLVSFHQRILKVLEMTPVKLV